MSNIRPTTIEDEISWFKRVSRFHALVRADSIWAKLWPFLVIFARVGTDTTTYVHLIWR